MKKFLNDLVKFIIAIFCFIGAIILTAFLFWPFIAIVLIFCVLFWILLPVIGWILLGLIFLFLILYVIVGIFSN